MLQKLRTYLGRVIRNIGRKIEGNSRLPIRRSYAINVVLAAVDFRGFIRWLRIFCDKSSAPLFLERVINPAEIIFFTATHCYFVERKFELHFERRTEGGRLRSRDNQRARSLCSASVYLAKIKDAMFDRTTAPMKAVNFDVGHQ